MRRGITRHRLWIGFQISGSVWSNVGSLSRQWTDSADGANSFAEFSRAEHARIAREVLRLSARAERKLKRYV
jgi:hypothetical protein